MSSVRRFHGHQILGLKPAVDRRSFGLWVLPCFCDVEATLLVSPLRLVDISCGAKEMTIWFQTRPARGRRCTTRARCRTHRAFPKSLGSVVSTCVLESAFNSCNRRPPCSRATYIVLSHSYPLRTYQPDRSARTVFRHWMQRLRNGMFSGTCHSEDVNNLDLVLLVLARTGRFDGCSLTPNRLQHELTI